MCIPRFHRQPGHRALIEADANGKDVRMSHEQPVIISFSVPQAMAPIVITESRYENQIYILNSYCDVTRRLRYAETADDKIIRGLCRIKRKVVTVDLREKEPLAVVAHEGKEIHLPLHRVIHGNVMGISVLGKAAYVAEDLDLGALLDLRGDPLPPFQYNLPDIRFALHLHRGHADREREEQAGLAELCDTASSPLSFRG